MLRIFRHHLSAPALLLFVVENLIFTILFLWLVQASRLARLLAPRPADEIFHGGTVFTLAVLLSVVLWSIGAYDKWDLDDLRRLAGRLVAGFIIAFPLSLALLYVQGVKLGADGSLLPIFCAVAFVISQCGMFVGRVAMMRFAEAAKLKRRVLVLGVGERAAKIAAFIEARPDRSLEVVGYLRAANEETKVDPALVVAQEDELNDIVRRLHVEEIVVALNDRRGVPVQPLLSARLGGIAIIDYLTFWERETGQVMLDALDPSWLIYSDGFRVGRRVNSAVKRLLDLLVSAIFVVFLGPFMLLVALAVKLDSSGPIFYVQERVGRNGRVFPLYKFRSMCQDAERNGISQWAAANDPRITRIGSFLRKTRIDEIPQILNVLRGDMSFIGPRPERPFFVESLSKEIRYYNERARVRPGITGWAQINYPYGASVEDAREKLSYDFYYIKNYSLMLDLLVLMATVQVVFFPKGVR